MTKKMAQRIERVCVICGDDSALGCVIAWYGDLCHSCLEHLLDVAFNDYIDDIDEQLNFDEKEYIESHS